MTEKFSISKFIRFFFLSFFLLSCTFSVRAQYKITGSLKDTANFGFTEFTSVSLIRAGDSILQSFTRANQEGYFSINVQDTGTYLLLLENPQYASSFHKIQISGNTDLGLLPLIPFSIIT